MHVSDWYPTILNLAGGSTEELTLDGFDQWPTISGSAPYSPRKELLHNIGPLMPKFGFKKRGSPFDNRQTAALRVGDYKIVTGLPALSNWYKPDTVQEVQKALTADEVIEKEFNSPVELSILQNIFLFNITADPFEQNDLSEEKPEVVDKLLRKLAEYEERAVPPLNPLPEPDAANPSLHGNSWEHWQ